MKTGILNVYYFPDGAYHMLYDTITPVNSFRILFNKFSKQVLIYYQTESMRRPTYFKSMTFLM